MEDNTTRLIDEISKEVCNDAEKAENRSMESRPEDDDFLGWI